MRILTSANGTSSLTDYFFVCLLPRIVVFLHMLLTFGHFKVLGTKTKSSSLPVMPVFRNTSSNFTYSEGQLAILKCSVQNLGTRTVIWRRMTYPNPLTVGEFIYVPDDRFTIHHIPKNGDWNLLIKNIKRADAGIYECQISSKEKYFRKLIQVRVVDDPIGPREISLSGPHAVEKGESVVLACNATGGRTAPHDLDWWKDNTKLVSDKSGRVNITKHISYVTQTIVSNLTIKGVRIRDGGMYVCRTSDGLVKNISIEVTGGGSENVKRTISQQAPVASKATSSKAVLYVITFVLLFHCSSALRYMLHILTTSVT